MAAAANALSPRTPVDPLPSAGSPEQLVLGSKIEDPLPLVGEQLVDPLGANGREAPRQDPHRLTIRSRVGLRADSPEPVRGTTAGSVTTGTSSSAVESWPSGCPVADGRRSAISASAYSC